MGGIKIYLDSSKMGKSFKTLGLISQVENKLFNMFPSPLTSSSKLSLFRKGLGPHKLDFKSVIHLMALYYTRESLEIAFYPLMFSTVCV